MPFITDQNRLGWVPAQDHRSVVGTNSNPVALKNLVWCCRVTMSPEGHDLPPVPFEKSIGPLTGAFLWPPQDFQDHPPAWFMAAPAQLFSNGTVANFQGTVTLGTGKQVRVTTVAPSDPSQFPKLSTRAITGDYANAGTPYLPLRVLPQGQEPTYPFNERYPGFYPATVLQGVDYGAQRLTAMPAFAGIVAPHLAGSADLGSCVYGVNAKDELDFTYKARAQSFWRTYRLFTDVPTLRFGAANPPPGGELAGIAWQCGTTRGGRQGAEAAYAGHGIICDDAPPPGRGVTDRPTTGADANPSTTVERASPLGQNLGLASQAGANSAAQGLNQTFGVCSIRGGGPFDVGALQDKHFHSANNIGERLNPTHFTTNTLFRDSGTGPFSGVGTIDDRDAPLEFSGKYVPPSHGPLLVFTYLRYDPDSQHQNAGRTFPGLWRWETETLFGLILDPPPKRKPKKPPPIGDPFPPPDGVPPDGSGLIVPNPGANPLPEGPGTFDPSAGGPNKPLELPSKIFTGFNPIGLALAGAPNEIAFGAQAFRAQNFQVGQPDLRNRFEPLTPEERRAWQEQPVVARLEAAGRQAGASFKRTSRDAARYAGMGTANGALWFMPPEMGLERLSVPGTVSTTYFGLWNSRLAWGTPLLTGASAGGVASGWSQYLDSSGYLVLDKMGATGSGTQYVQFQGAVSEYRNDPAVDMAIDLRTANGIGHIRARSSNGTHAVPTASTTGALFKVQVYGRDSGVTERLAGQLYNEFTAIGASSVSSKWRLETSDSGTAKGLEVSASGRLSIGALATAAATIVPTGLTAARSFTLQDADGTLAHIDTAQTFTATQTFADLKTKRHLARVYNDSGASITGATAPVCVRLTGYDSGTDLAEVTAISLITQIVLGVAVETIANGAAGAVLKWGMILATGLDTSASAIDAAVYTDGSGALTLTPGGPKVGRVASLANPGRVWIDVRDLS